MKIILHIDVAGRLVRLYYLPQEKPNNMIDAWSWIDEIKEGRCRAWRTCFGD